MDNRLEERYVVVKLSKLTEHQRARLKEVLFAYKINTTDCVVVEHDWPMYTDVVDMVLGAQGGD